MLDILESEKKILFSVALLFSMINIFGSFSWQVLRLKNIEDLYTKYLLFIRHLLVAGGTTLWCRASFLFFTFCRIKLSCVKASKLD